MKNEIIKNKYLFYNFMFMFPYFKKNKLTNKLESKLQEFEKDKFIDKEYYNNVIKNNEYWKMNY
jgi:hypothetical protein